VSVFISEEKILGDWTKRHLLCSCIYYASLPEGYRAKRTCTISADQSQLESVFTCHTTTLASLPKGAGCHLLFYVFVFSNLSWLQKNEINVFKSQPCSSHHLLNAYQGHKASKATFAQQCLSASLWLFQCFIALTVLVYTSSLRQKYSLIW